jgi:FAD/FMN-containing dehydrogenase
MSEVLGKLEGQRIMGWGRRPVGTTDLVRPERLRELPELIADHGSCVARGLGRSYGDASFNSDGDTILMERIDRFIGFDESSGVLECESGVTIGDVIKYFVPQGYLPPVIPGTKHVTLGGALASDIHGKNHHKDGSFSRQVVDFKLLTASGEVVTCSREENADLFWATAGGMGLTGIIMSLRMKLLPVESGYVSVDIDRTNDLDRTLELFHESDERYKYSVAWVDGLASGASLGRSVLMRGNPAPADGRRGLDVKKRMSLSVPGLFPGRLLNRMSVKAFNALYPFFFPLDAAHDWNRLYGRRGFIQYQCAIPYEGGRDGLVEILDLVRTETAGSFLTVLKRFGPVEDGQLLSFPIPGYTLAMDIPWRGKEIESILNDIDEVVMKRGGRVYLTKDARMTARSLRRMYPRLRTWSEIKSRFDPKDRFASDLGHRLELLR